MATTQSNACTVSIREQVGGDIWPMPDPPDTAYQLILAETDSPSGTEANRQFHTLWKQVNGDWHDRDGVLHGTNHYATAQCPAVGSDLTLQVGTLVTELLNNNRGFYVRSVSGGPVNFASKENTTYAGFGPRLTVHTNTASFSCPCICDLGITQSSGTSTSIGNPLGLKFDLSLVSGTVTSAVLQIRVIQTFTPAPGVWAANLLWMPRVYTDPANELPGGVRYGIASEVAQDSALATHPSVVYWEHFPSFVDSWRHFDLWPNGTNDSSKYAIPTQSDGFDEFVSMPEYGSYKIRVHSPTAGGVTIFNRKKIFCPPGHGNPWATFGPPRPYQWDWGQGPEELYLRYLMRIDPNMDKVSTSGGMKIPGLDGSFEFLDPAVDPTTGPPFPQGTRPLALAQAWSCRNEVSVNTIAPQLRANPGIHKLWAYVMKSQPVNNQIGRSALNRQSNTCLRAGQMYSIEQRIKLNTHNGAADMYDPLNWNWDGELDLWVDGVLVLRENNHCWRTNPYVQFYNTHLSFQHGGQTASSGRFFIEIGNICVAREYIGPPKVI